MVLPSTNKKNSLIICDDDPLYSYKIRQLLKHSFECFICKNTDEALVFLKHRSVQILLLDIQMRTEAEGLESIPHFLKIDPDLSIIINTVVKDPVSLQKAIQLGATNYFIKHQDADELVHTLTQAIDRQNLIKKYHQQTFEALSFHQKYSLIGESDAIKNLKKIIEKVKKSHSHVILFGETGTGKELVARQLRETLPDQTLAPFIAIDSATIQSNMAESLLFGHERGAFTGAEKMNKGLFEQANGGIIYFDEISNMPLSIQSKLLRVLQEKEILRLGSSRPIQLHFRVICATNKNLKKMTQKNQFKEDLFQRLNVIPINLPPLRERTEDVPLLIEHFCKKYSNKEKKLIFPKETLRILENYLWPGNIRELSNWIEYLTTMSDKTSIDAEDIFSRFGEISTKNLKNKSSFKLKNESFYEKVAYYEASLLSQELSKHSGSITAVAKALKMDRSHLYSKLKKYKIYKTKK